MNPKNPKNDLNFIGNLSDSEDNNIIPKDKPEVLTMGDYESWNYKIKSKFPSFFKKKKKALSSAEIDKQAKKYTDELKESLLNDEKKLMKEKIQLIENSKLPQKDHIPLYKLEELHMQEYKAQQTEQLKSYYNPNKLDKLPFGDWSNIKHLSKTEEELPKFYKDLNLPEDLTSFNIGNKLGASLVSSIKSRRKFEKSFSRGKGAYIYQSIKRGRLGVDLYLLFFAFGGALFIPYYFYKKGRPLKDLVDKKRKIIDDVVLKCENSKYDIDDISIHEKYNTMYKKEIEDYKMEKFKIKREIRKLENELYSNVE